MMTALLVLLAVAVNAAIALVTARMVFARVRDRIIETADSGNFYMMSPEARIQGAGIILTITCLGGLWPLLLATALVMAKPPRTPAEMRARQRRDQQRIAELERELGMKP
jgi:hypothetical protein